MLIAVESSSFSFLPPSAPLSLSSCLFLPSSFLFQQNFLYIIYKHRQPDLAFDPLDTVYRLLEFILKRQPPKKTKSLSSLR